MRSLFIATIIALALLACAEGVLRGYFALTERQTTGNKLPSAALRQDYLHDDPVLGYALNPGRYRQGITINSLGLRGPELSTIPMSGTTRIVCIGDSTTFGLGGAGCTYPAQMQAILDAQAPGKFESINAGVEGYSTLHVTRMIAKKITTLSPDIILLYVGWNDIYVPLHIAGKRPPAETPLQRLYLARLARRLALLDLPRWLAHFRTGGPDSAHSFSPGLAQEYKTRLAGLVAAALATTAKTVLVTLPNVFENGVTPKALAVAHYPYWAYGDPHKLRASILAFNNLIRETGRATQTPVLDLAQAVAALDEGGVPLFFDTLHPTCKGQEVLARLLLENLVRMNLLPKRHPEQ